MSDVAGFLSYTRTDDGVGRIGLRLGRTGARRLREELGVERGELRGDVRGVAPERLRDGLRLEVAQPSEVVVALALVHGGKAGEGVADVARHRVGHAGDDHHRHERVGREDERGGGVELEELADLPRDEVQRIVATMEDDMRSASEAMDFEEAARLRDAIVHIKAMLEGESEDAVMEALRKNARKGSKFASGRKRQGVRSKMKH